MKKIIGIVIASMMFANIGFAKMTLIEENIIKSGIKNFKRNVVSTVCIDGFKFVITATTGGRSIVQFMIPGPRIDSPPYPAEC